jgi:hypothetical protein
MRLGRDEQAGRRAWSQVGEESGPLGRAAGFSVRRPEALSGPIGITAGGDFKSQPGSVALGVTGSAGGAMWSDLAGRAGTPGGSGPVLAADVPLVTVLLPLCPMMRAMTLKKAQPRTDAAERRTVALQPLGRERHVIGSLAGPVPASAFREAMWF